MNFADIQLFTARELVPRMADIARQVRKELECVNPDYLRHVRDRKQDFVNYCLMTNDEADVSAYTLMLSASPYPQ